MPVRTIFLVVLAVSACSASSGGPSPDVTAIPVTDRVAATTGAGLTFASTSTSVGIPGTVAAPLEDTFRALTAVYADLGIAAADLHPAEHSLGNETFKARRRLGGVPMQKYFDCGGNSGQPNSETYNMVISISSYVTAGKDGGSIVTTRIRATGSDPAHGASDQIRCTSEGELELRIAQMTRERLGVKK